MKCDVCGKEFDKNELVPCVDDSDGTKAMLCPLCYQKAVMSMLEELSGVTDIQDLGSDKECSINDKEVQFSLTPAEIMAELNRHVIGQEKAKKVLSVAIYNHYQRIKNNRFDIQKSNIMLVGSTGVGKTELARSIAKILDVPFFIADATSVTESGYVGNDVENIVRGLLIEADWDVERAERGIIYIDEIDKIARKGDNPSITRDVSGEGVQQALLKIVEGSDIEVQMQGGRRHPQADCIHIDTSNILFICGGAFESVTMHKDSKKSAIGFGGSSDVDAPTKRIDSKALVKAGMIPELVGRLPIIVELNDLTEEDLKRILVEPENSIISQYSDLVSLTDNAKLTVTDEALTHIAHEAYSNKTGARGLKAIIEDKMMDALFDLPSAKGKTGILVEVENDEVVCKLVA